MPQRRLPGEGPRQPLVDERDPSRSTQQERRKTERGGYFGVAFAAQAVELRLRRRNS